MNDVNLEQIEYWNAKAGPTWVAEQEHLDAQLRPLGEMSIVRLGVSAGARVLDVGCGCGEHSLELARHVGPRGAVVGVDISEPMLARARERAAGHPNVSFHVADAQAHRFTSNSFDFVSSRFGVMFFADFGAAFANLRAALRPGGRLGFVCWQELAKNEWMNVPMRLAAKHFELPPAGPPGSPGPFGLDDPDRIRRALAAAGFADVAIEDVREPQNVGGARTIAEAVAFLSVAGPAAAALRGAPPDVRARFAEALTEALAPYATERGVVLPAAAWIVTAGTPQARGRS